MEMDLELLSTGAIGGTALARARPTPLVGTPTAQPREGNSAPAQTLAAEKSKSERTGERRRSK